MSIKRKLQVKKIGKILSLDTSIGKDPDAGKDWGQKKKGVTEDEVGGWHHWLNGHESEQTPEDSEGQGNLHAAVPGVTKSQTQLSDWTTTTIWYDHRLLLFRDLCGSVPWELSEHTFQIETSDHALLVCVCTFLSIYFTIQWLFPLQVRGFLGRLLSALLEHKHAEKSIARTPLLPCNIRASDSKPTCPSHVGTRGVAARGSGQTWCSSDMAPCSCSRREILSKWLNDLLIFPCN